MSGERNASRERLANNLGVKSVLAGKLFDRLIYSVAKTIHPGMRANDGLDQALVARDFR